MLSAPIFISRLDFAQLVEVLRGFDKDCLEAFIAETFDRGVSSTKFGELNARMATEQFDVTTIAC
jgi:hypothetical protein